MKINHAREAIDRKQGLTLAVLTLCVWDRSLVNKHEIQLNRASPPSHRRKLPSIQSRSPLSLASEVLTVSILFLLPCGSFALTICSVVSAATFTPQQPRQSARYPC